MKKSSKDMIQGDHKKSLNRDMVNEQVLSNEFDSIRDLKPRQNPPQPTQIQAHDKVSPATQS